MEYHCASCGKQITQQESEDYGGLCSDCYEFEQQENDYEMEEE